MNLFRRLTFAATLVGILGISVAAAGDSPSTMITISTDEVVNKMTDPHPLGINLNFFNDNDNYLKPARKLSAALKEMGVKYLRYPGGDKSDYYLFSVPPYDKAIATLSQTGPGTNESRAEFLNANRSDYNREVLNFDEFMTVCHESGAKPVIVCAIDTYVQTHEKLPHATRVSSREDFLRNAAEWVRYANIKHDYKIKYWMLGNESWIAWYKGPDGKYYGYEPEVYAQDLVDFSAAMKAVDPSIKIIANGGDWTVKQYLPQAANSIDYICTSNYPLAATPYTKYEDWVNRSLNHGDLIVAAEKVLTTIDSCPSISPEKKASLQVIDSEFGPHTWWPRTWGNGQDLGHAMCNFDIIGQQLSNPRIFMSLFWNTRWEGHGRNYNYDALDDNNSLSPDGQSLALWCKYLFSEIVRTSSSRGLVTYASYSSDKNQLYFDVINQGATDRSITLKVPDRTIFSITKVAEMSGASPSSAQTTCVFNVHDEVSGSGLTLDPYSVTVFHLRLSVMTPAHL